MNILKFTYALDQLQVQHLKLNNLIEATENKINHTRKMTDHDAVFEETTTSSNKK